jgi:hypothetical protein
LAVWLVANAVEIALLVVNPKITRSACGGHWIDSPAAWFRSLTSDEEFGQDLCFRDTYPLTDRGVVAVGAVLGNGVALAAWVTAKPKG